MKPIISIALFLVIFLMGTSCSQQDMMNKLVDQKDVDLARGLLQQLNAGYFRSISEKIDPSLNGASLDESLQKIAELIPDSVPLSETIVGYQANDVGNVSTRNITFEWQYADGWVLANAAVKRTGNEFTIIGMSAQPMKQSLADMHKFTLAGKSFQHYLMLVIALATIGLIGYALYLCVKTPIQQRKWLWIVFILVGVGKFSIDWTSGAMGFAPFSVLLFGVAAMSPLYGPWIVSSSLPVGAVVFLLRRNRLDSRNQVTSTTEENGTGS